MSFPFMKAVFVILDGIGDLPCQELDDKTPLEAADTPHLNALARRGKLGLVYPVRKGFVPESSEGILSLFGNTLNACSRGQMECVGADLSMKRGDLALRCNFATIDNPKSKNILDRRVGRTLTTKEASALTDAIRKYVHLPVPFIFENTIQHRGVLVFRGGFSDLISSNDSHYAKGEHVKQDKIRRVISLSEEDDNASYTANIVNEFLDSIYEVLDQHPVNVERRKKGLLPANYLLLRGPGTELPKLVQYPSWISMSYMPLEIGFSRLSGMKSITFEYPKLKSLDVYENLFQGLKKGCKYGIKTLKKYNKKFDYAYIHIKETDLPGHDGKPLEKEAMIAYLDKTLFAFLNKFSKKYNVAVIVTGDHSTPCILKAHSDHPVPVLISFPKFPEVDQRFIEKDAKKGILGTFTGKEFMSKTGLKR